MPTSRHILLRWGLWCLLGWAGSHCQADDWPQWMGRNRDGRWNQSGLIDSFEDRSVPELWSRSLGGGYSGPAVSAGWVYVTDFVSSDGPPANHPGVRDQRSGTERVWCLSADTGAVRWQTERPCVYRMSYASGPRATPTVVDDLVYCLGATGWLQCLRTADGTTVWSQDLTRYSGSVPWWGFSSHPLVEGELVTCLVGGPGSTVVAFDRRTGAERWKSGSASDPGYSAVNACQHDGRRMLIAWDADHLRGLDPDGGAELWRVPLAAEFKMAIAMPQVSGDVVYAGGKGRVGAAIRLLPGGRGVEPLWRARSNSGLFTSNAPPVIDGGMIYGCDCDTGHLRGVDLQTGERIWESLQPTTGGRPSPHATVFLVRMDARWLLFNDSGDLIFARLTREGYAEESRANVIEPAESAYGRSVIWTHPAFADGRVFVRSQRELKCVDLRESAQTLRNPE